jgi:hypothetical protein
VLLLLCHERRRLATSAAGGPAVTHSLCL